MKKKIIVIHFTIIFSILFIACSAFGEVSINGRIKTDNSFVFNNGQLRNNQNTFSLKFEYSTDKYYLFANPEMKISFLSSVSSLSNLQNIEQIFPYSLNLKEAYVDIYEFLLPVLDVRIGKQIIVWGTGDKINPTSNVSPSDLSDLFNFGEKLGINAISMNLYIGNFIFTGIYTPGFTPTLLPDNFQQMAGVSLGTPTLDYPGQTLGERSQFALKVNWPIFTYDFSVSYYYGRYTIPVVSEIYIQTDYSIDSSKSNFPRIHVLGLDFSGNIFDVGIWGELGVFIPEAYTVKTFYNHPTFGYILTDEISSEYYLRYVIGTDYTFKNGLYLNFQFAHGFDHEIGKDQLNDYFITRVEKSFFDDKLKIIPLAIVFTVNEWSDISNNYGVAYIPELQFFPADNLELDLGLYIIHGIGNNLFDNLKDDDALFFTAKVSF